MTRSRSLPTAELDGGSAPWHHLRAMRTDMIGYLEALAEQGERLRIPLGLADGFFFNELESVRSVLVSQASDFEKPAPVKYAAAGLFGQNLFTSDGEVWRVLRKAVQPAFHARRVEAYADDMARAAAQTVEQWNEGDQIDLPDEMMQLTMGVTTRALFGLDLRNEEAGRALVRFIELFNERISSPLPVPGWLPTPGNREMKRMIGVGTDLLQPLIEARRAQGKDHGDVLSLLLIAQAEDESGILDDGQVQNEITNLFAAGYEVTAYTVAFTLYLLLTHPEWLERVCDEVNASSFGSGPVLESVQGLDLLEMVIKESMRLLPVTTVVARQAAADCDVDGIAIGKRSLILVSPWTLHRNPRLFSDPLDFDPERFSAQRIDEIPKNGYIPFSTGPRVCLGSAFALLQIKVTLATLLQRVRFSLPDEYIFEPIYQFNTRLRHGLPLKIVETPL